MERFWVWVIFGASVADLRQAIVYSYEWAPGEAAAAGAGAATGTGTTAGGAASPSGGAAGAAPGAAPAMTTIYDNWNTSPVANRPSATPAFRLSEPMLIASITTLHLNSGRGMAPGAIGLRDDHGNLFGPWPAVGVESSGMKNVLWLAEPNAVLPAGSYTVTDSHPVSWSQNQQSRGEGFTVVSGRPASGAPAAPSRTAQATANALAAAGIEQWESDWGPVTLRYEGVPGSASLQVPVQGQWVQPAGFGDCPDGAGPCVGLFSGTFDTVTAALEISFFQDWNEQSGAGWFVLSPDGRLFPGIYTMENMDGDTDTWDMWRTEPSAAVR